MQHSFISATLPYAQVQSLGVILLWFCLLSIVRPNAWTENCGHTWHRILCTRYEFSRWTALPWNQWIRGMPYAKKFFHSIKEDLAKNQNIKTLFYRFGLYYFLIGMSGPGNKLVNNNMQWIILCLKFASSIIISVILEFSVGNNPSLWKHQWRCSLKVSSWTFTKISISTTISISIVNIITIFMMIIIVVSRIIIFRIAIRILITILINSTDLML